jgi:plastocyanin
MSGAFPIIASFAVGVAFVALALFLSLGSSGITRILNQSSVFYYEQDSNVGYDQCVEQIVGRQLAAEGITAKVPYRVHLNWQPVKSASSVATDGMFSIVFSDLKTGERVSSNVVYDFIYKGARDVGELLNRVADEGQDSFQLKDILHPCSLNFLIHVDSIGDTVLFDPTSDPEYDIATHGNMSPIGIQFQVIQAPTGMFEMKTITGQVVEVIIPEGASSPGGNFEPATINVVIGSNNTVRWINQDSIPSSIVADNDRDSSFFNATQDSSGNPTDQSLLIPGESFEYTFDKPGIFGYHSVPHPNMRSSVIVLPSKCVGIPTIEEKSDSAARVAKSKQNLAEAQALFSKKLEEEAKIAEYEKQKEIARDEQEIGDLNGKIQTSLEAIDGLQKQIGQLEGARSCTR